MTDIVERLRKWAEFLNSFDHTGDDEVADETRMLNLAADCIERLRAQVAEGRGLLMELRGSSYTPTTLEILDRIDAALASKGKQG